MTMIVSHGTKNIRRLFHAFLLCALFCFLTLSTGVAQAANSWDGSTGTLEIDTYVGSLQASYFALLTGPEQADAPHLKVKHLEITGAPILTQADFTYIANMTNLQTLDLADTTAAAAVVPVGYDNLRGWLEGFVSLTTAALPTGLTTTGENAFKNCISLKTITFNNDIEVISDDAFLGCTKLEAITLPATVTTIGNDAFGDCIELKTADLSACNVLTAVNGFRGCLALETLKLPTSLETIEPAAFRDCISLRTADLSTLPLLKVISDDAFRGCTALDEILLPDSLEKVGDRALYDCTNLTEVDFSDTNLNYLGEYVFFGYNSKLVVVSFPATPPTFKNTDLFGVNAGIATGIRVPEGFMIFVPSGSSAAYKSLLESAFPGRIAVTGSNIEIVDKPASPYTMQKGETFTFAVNVSPNVSPDVTPYTILSTNSGIASAAIVRSPDMNVVTANELGTATIRVQVGPGSDPGLYDEFSVRVVSADVPGGDTSISNLRAVVGSYEITAERTGENAYRLTLPPDANIAAVQLKADLPTGATIDPSLATPLDFTGGARTFVITAPDGVSKRTITVSVTVAPSYALERSFFSSVAADCSIIVVDNGNGTPPVQLKIPFLATLDPYLIESVTVIPSGFAYLGSVRYSFVDVLGSEVQIRSVGVVTRPYLQSTFSVMGSGEDLLAHGAIAQIDYRLKNDPFHYTQTYARPLEFSSMPSQISPGDHYTGGSSSGCDAGAGAALALLLSAGYIALGRARKATR